MGLVRKSAVVAAAMGPSRRRAMVAGVGNAVAVVRVDNAGGRGWGWPGGCGFSSKKRTGIWIWVSNWSISDSISIKVGVVGAVGAGLDTISML